ncbi:MAG: HU family DNA-binding protein, partial [Deltaproteobacteria bacterium]|nr:HU family DNA-binding protein [Deltaproteobacteria bacterium]
MAHKELINKIYKDLQQHRIPKKAVEEMVGEIFCYIEKKLIQQQSFSINSFGRWYTKAIQEKTGCHPTTQEPIYIPACKKVVFKPSTNLTQKLK